MTRRECPVCGGLGLVIRGERDHALAQRCACRSPCPDCGGSGYHFKVDERGYETAVACVCAKLEKRERLFNSARLPARYHAATLGIDSFLVRPGEGTKGAARQRAYDFAKSFVPGERGLLFYGPCGTGKTHLLVGISRHVVLHRGVGVRFVEFLHLLSDLRATFGESGRVEDVMGPLIEVPVLAVDELGKGRGSEWELQVLDELISKRYNAKRTTLFTTNYFPKAETEGEQTLGGRIGERIHSRLMEMCELQPLLGDDFRVRIADQGEAAARKVSMPGRSPRSATGPTQ